MSIQLKLTHWGRMTYICVSNIISIGSDNGLSPVRRQAIIWTNAWILLIWPLGTTFSEILIEIHIFSFKKMRLKMSSARRRPFCLGLNVLNTSSPVFKRPSPLLETIGVSRVYIVGVFTWFKRRSTHGEPRQSSVTRDAYTGIHVIHAGSITELNNFLNSPFG